MSAQEVGFGITVVSPVESLLEFDLLNDSNIYSRVCSLLYEHLVSPPLSVGLREEEFIELIVWLRETGFQVPLQMHFHPGS